MLSHHLVWTLHTIYGHVIVYTQLRTCMKSVFTSFSSLSARFNLLNSHLFRFFQTRHFVQKLFPHFPNRPPEYVLDVFFDLKPNDKHLISVIYNLVNTMIPDLSKRFKEIWEQDLSIPISDEQWSYILYWVHSSSICARHGLIQCKVLYRAHLTNAQLWPWTTKPVLSRWGIFVAISNNTLCVSKLFIFLLCQKSSGHQVKIMFHEDIL